MQVFNTSLGCTSAPYIYEHHTVTYAVDVGEADAHHAFDSRGDASGTITLSQGMPNATQVIYEMTVRSNHLSLLDHVKVKSSSPEVAKKRSRFLLSTPRIKADSNQCMRFDITLFIPP